MAKEWSELCARAFTSTAVSGEPRIHRGRDTSEAAGSTGTGVIIDPDLRGDIGVHGFWKRGFSTIFDVRITGTDAPTYRGQDPHKVLKKRETEKKKKYTEACQARRRHFTPLVFSVDGMYQGSGGHRCKQSSGSPPFYQTEASVL